MIRRRCIVSGWGWFGCTTCSCASGPVSSARRARCTSSGAGRTCAPPASPGGRPHGTAAVSPTAPTGSRNWPTATRSPVAVTGPGAAARGRSTPTPIRSHWGSRAGRLSRPRPTTTPISASSSCRTPPCAPRRPPTRRSWRSSRAPTTLLPSSRGGTGPPSRPVGTRSEGGEGVAEGGARRDPEFGEDAVQVGSDRAMGQEELLADLLVGEAAGGELSDLAFLGGERPRLEVLRFESGRPRGPQLASRSVGPRLGPEAPERVEGGAEVLPGQRRRPRPPEAFAVGELDPGQVERPPAGSGGGQGLFEEGDVVAVGTGDRGGPRGDERQSGRERRHGGGAHDVAVGDGFRRPVGTDGRLHHVQHRPEGQGDVGREGTRRADGGQLVIGGLAVTPSEGGEPPGVPGEGLDDAGAAGCRPTVHLVGQRPGGVVVAAGGSDDRLAEPQGPGQELIAVGFAQRQAFVGQLQRFVPFAAQVVVETEAG